ncbi:hypothetical protein IKE88_00135 [Candidatus Saccharibacteria bacterium]|nr:hypothetical protein [Candidatus Saccharibacteria bacterium]
MKLSHFHDYRTLEVISNITPEEWRSLLVFFPAYKLYSFINHVWSESWNDESLPRYIDSNGQQLVGLKVTRQNDGSLLFSPCAPGEAKLRNYVLEIHKNYLVPLASNILKSFSNIPRSYLHEDFAMLRELCEDIYKDGEGTYKCHFFLEEE